MSDDLWTVKRILDWIQSYLGERGDESPRISAQWLVADALGVDRLRLFLDLERPLRADERAALRDYAPRRAAAEPLQYITGKVDFRYIQLRIKSGVLIPRPETEVLVSEALGMLPAAPKPQEAVEAALVRLAYAQRDAQDPADDSTVVDQSVLDAIGPLEEPADNGELLVADICTGSGCIACSIAYEHPNAFVYATDISDEAVCLARDNCSTLGLENRIDVLCCDLGSGIDQTLMGTFDLIVSNPPYVPTALLSSIPQEVSAYEPSLALDGGDDGLDVFRRLIAWSKQALKPMGGVAFELHEECLDDAARIAHEAGFCEIRIVNDLADRPRILCARNQAE